MSIRLPSLQTINPVLDIELRQRSRSRRSVVVLTIFLTVMVLVSLLVYEASTATNEFNFDPISALTNGVGRKMFEWVLAAELGILLLIVPGISAGTISGERDRQTLVPLQVTMIGPWGIFMGKVLSSSSFILLLIVATVPVMAVPYLVGGISLTQVLLSLLSLLILGFLLAVMGVACSAIFKRTQIATLMAYALCAALTVGTLIVMVTVTVIQESRGQFVDSPPFWPLYANPFVAIADAAGDISGQFDGPFSPIKRFFWESQNQFNQFGQFEGDVGFQNFDEFGNPIFIDEGFPGAPQRQEPGFSGIPLWVRSLGTLAMISLLMSLAAVRKLKAPRTVMSA